MNEVIEFEVADLRERYEVDVDGGAEPTFMHVIVRDWPIPSDAYTKETTDTLIRVPQKYPNQAPDWIFVEPDLRVVETGERPKDSYHDNTDGQVKLNGWLALSYHVTRLDNFQWQPYETDLLWYVDVFTAMRFRNGD